MRRSHVSGVIVLAAGVLGGLASPAQAADAVKPGNPPGLLGRVAPVVQGVLNAASEYSQLEYDQGLTPHPARSTHLS
ncbi:hypothetical protein [Streptomyces chattanoogensis]|uniref:hypothetical protein n=1 Tax=Streptomyces chattanoogensis TaxID=66876 RepID=UPI000AEEDC25